MKKYFVLFDGMFSSIILTDNYGEYDNYLGAEEADGPFRTFTEAKNTLISYATDRIKDHRHLLKETRKLKKKNVYTGEYNED